MALPEKKVKKLIELMNSTTESKIPPQKPIIRCFELGMDEDILEYLLRVGVAPHDKETLRQLFCTMVAMGEISGKRTWDEMWAEITEMSFLIPEPGGNTYGLASIFPGWIELSTSGPTNAKRLAILNSFMDFYKLLKALNVGPLRALTNHQGMKNLENGVPPMQTLTSVVPAGKPSSSGAGKSSRVIHLDQQLESQQRVLPVGTAFEILANHKDHIAVMNCFCRTYKQMNGGDACDHDLPLESCVTVGSIADQLVATGVGRHVPYEEAVAMMEEFERKGCIHTTFHRGGNSANDTLAICNCCTECCLLYGGYQQGYTSKIFVKAYNRPRVVDSHMCTGCNLCGKHCPSDAIRYDQARKELVFEYEKCVGCGQCVTQCRFGVQEMVPDERSVFVKTKKKSHAHA